MFTPYVNSVFTEKHALWRVCANCTLVISNIVVLLLHANCRNPSDSPHRQAALNRRMRDVIQAGKVLKNVETREQYDNGEAMQ